MPRPFVAYLRVYEPLSTFAEPLAGLLRGAVEVGGLDRADAAAREREVWLKSQLAGSVLPGELPDGRPTPSSIRDLLVIDPAEVPGSAAGSGPLVCPLDLRARSAAAMVGFLATSGSVLRDAVLGSPPDAIRRKATSVLGELPSGAVHVVSTTWTVPLPWFSLVDPDARHVVLAPREDPRREVFWRATLADALARVERAHTLTKRTFGETGPTKVLADTAQWLGNFAEGSAVELDYGGLVQLLTDEELTEDSSAEDVHAILDAIERSDPGEVGERFERLRDFWGDLAAREQLN
ncbi:hypothetical protein V5P93_007150 [Actinokineospora auranticolor]|uniref:DUF8083 domain-containing protein n=1 Tax=Actinokineospora auranticolor TaxID=155976 RepID=A0A2S6GRD5_9PSEU|nr:hypothetical protein [Actinokineospora auranticolor]PPK67808.1 hypothetical protein CLV40_10638 [Actinokineospora auranticolor]